MANGPEITSASGLRRIQIFALNSSGYPEGDESGADGYDGVNMEGARSFSLNAPDVTRIPHVGNDRLLAQDFLPPTEGASGAITTAKQNLTLDALLTDTLVEVIGETSVAGLLTNKQGNEIDVCVIAYRQALDTTEGAQQLRRWQAHMLPVARIVPRGGSMEQGAADENSYTVVPTVATKYPFGHAFADQAGDEGFTESQYLRFTGENPPVMEKWDGNNTLATFNLNWTPISVAKTTVYVNGTAATVSSVDTGAKTLTLSAAPANASEVVAWYETSDDI
jgi:hypothetical protein